MKHTVAAGTETIEIEAESEPIPFHGGWIVSGSSVELLVSFVADRFYRHGWHSWSLTRWEDLDAPPVRLADDAGGFGADNVEILGPEHRGSWVGAISDGSGAALVLGSLGFDAHVTGTAQSLRGESPGGPVEWFVGFGNAEEVLEHYGRELGERLGNARRAPGRVWCSWYSYYQGIDEAQMVEVIDGLDDMGFDVVQIDDGWQVEIGDWTVNGDFPSGMDGMAERVTAAGYRPGIWVAPFIAHERSRTLRDHPDWFVARDGAPAVAGRGWGGAYYALDTTHPEVVEHLRSVIERAVSWGYTYLKLDFLFAAAIPGGRHDESVTGEQAYRAGIELIRAAAGEDTYLLACGSLIVPSIGVFNGMRVGQDVAPHWDNPSGGIEYYSEVSTRFAISNSLARLWLDTVIAVDPDVVYFRSEANELTRDQMQSLQDIASVCGFVATSDPPHWMSDDERGEMRRYMGNDPSVERLGRYDFLVDGRPVTFRDVSLDV